jgi:3-deoxy-7-phosphoheptulonate synthase
MSDPQAQTTSVPGGDGWTPDSWRARLDAQQVRYRDRGAVDAAVRKLSSLPPLVTSWEIERLKEEIAEAQDGAAVSSCRGATAPKPWPTARRTMITGKLKILLQMSLVLVHGLKRPVTRIGRFAGQYAKPRSSPTETRVVDGAEVELPSYFGDLVNRPEFTRRPATPDPHLMVRGYQHAAMTLNFIRSLPRAASRTCTTPRHWDMSVHGARGPDARTAGAVRAHARHAGGRAALHGGARRAERRAS